MRRIIFIDLSVNLLIFFRCNNNTALFIKGASVFNFNCNKDNACAFGAKILWFFNYVVQEGAKLNCCVNMHSAFVGCVGAKRYLLMRKAQRVDLCWVKSM